jgi:hypothetical protein
LSPEQNWDLIATDLIDLADRLGCQAQVRVG